MLRGYRLFVLALGLALACANHAYAEGGKQQPQAEQSVAKSLDDIAAASSQQAERAKRADKDEAPCGQGQYGSNADLCAQWKAADAASDSAWWAWVAAISTIVSTAAVLVAIGLTYQANAIARDTAKRQLRAYIGVTASSISISPDNKGFIIQVELKNAGQTPAYEVAIMGESFGADYPLTNERAFGPLEDGHRCPLYPGDSLYGVYALKAEGVSADLVMKQVQTSGNMGLYVQGLCEYLDAFGERHTTQFRYVCGGRIALTSGMIMHAALTGNTAT